MHNVALVDISGFVPIYSNLINLNIRVVVKTSISFWNLHPTLALLHMICYTIERLTTHMVTIPSSSNRTNTLREGIKRDCIHSSANPLRAKRRLICIPLNVQSNRLRGNALLWIRSMAVTVEEKVCRRHIQKMTDHFVLRKPWKIWDKELQPIGSYSAEKCWLIQDEFSRF